MRDPDPAAGTLVRSAFLAPCPGTKHVTSRNASRHPRSGGASADCDPELGSAEGAADGERRFVKVPRSGLCPVLPRSEGQSPWRQVPAHIPAADQLHVRQGEEEPAGDVRLHRVHVAALQRGARRGHALLLRRARPGQRARPHRVGQQPHGDPHQRQGGALPSRASGDSRARPPGARPWPAAGAGGDPSPPALSPGFAARC